MWEKYEKFWILGIIALAIYYFYKKGKPTTSTPGVGGTADFSGFAADFSNVGSTVNPTLEPGSLTPAETSTPVLYRPAQPSTVPVSQHILVGQFNYSPGMPVMRIPPGGYLA